MFHAPSGLTESVNQKTKKSKDAVGRNVVKVDAQPSAGRMKKKTQPQDREEEREDARTGTSVPNADCKSRQEDQRERISDSEALQNEYRYKSEGY